MSSKPDGFLANLFLFGIVLLMCGLFVPALVRIESDAQVELWLYTIGIGFLCVLLSMFFISRNK